MDRLDPWAEAGGRALAKAMRGEITSPLDDL
jgi:hypothetical protein